MSTFREKTIEQNKEIEQVQKQLQEYLDSIQPHTSGAVMVKRNVIQTLQKSKVGHANMVDIGTRRLLYLDESKKRIYEEYMSMDLQGVVTITCVDTDRIHFEVEGIVCKIERRLEIMNKGQWVIERIGEWIYDTILYRS